MSTTTAHLNFMQEIEAGVVTVGKDIGHGVEYPVEFLIKAERVIASAIQDQPEIKTAVLDMAQTVIADSKLSWRSERELISNSGSHLETSYTRSGRQSGITPRFVLEVPMLFRKHPVFGLYMQKSVPELVRWKSTYFHVVWRLWRSPAELDLPRKYCATPTTTTAKG